MTISPVHVFDRAICRRPARSVTAGLRATDRGDPAFARVVVEHAAYVAALEAAGVTVDVLEALDDFPDSMFVEDPALVFTEGAILLRPGIASRAGETETIEPALRARFKTVLPLPAGTADGGDVLVTPDAVLIGLSARTDRTGAQALAGCLETLGRRARIVETPPGVLHFKSDCSLLDGQTVLVTARLAASGIFAGLRQVIVLEGEEAAANALRINGVVLAGRDHGHTRTLIESHGYSVVPLDVAEIGKVDAGLSCMSLRWRADPTFTS